MGSKKCPARAFSARRCAGWTRHCSAVKSTELRLASCPGTSILFGRLGVPMGLRRTVLRYNWTVFLAVISASVAEVCLFTHTLVGRLFRMLMPRRGATPSSRQELLSTDPDRSRQSLLPPPASCPKPCECRTPLAARGLKNRAPSSARFAGHNKFSHPIFDSHHEILSILPVGPRLAPWLQKPFGRTARPVLGRTSLRRRQSSSCPLAVAENSVFFHRLQESGGSASEWGTHALAFV